MKAKEKINLRLKQLPSQDRPYEKYQKHGAEFLTNAELLAIILRSGSREANCVEVAQKILSMEVGGVRGFEYLKIASLEELKKIKGIGNVKAVQIKVLIELANRIKNENKTKYRITCPKDAMQLVASSLQEKQIEELKVIILNAKNYVQSIITVAKGRTNQLNVTMKEIFSEPIKQLATSIILVHNHPSGDVTPSRADIQLTRKVASYGPIFDISLADHIIIGKEEYVSLKETDAEIFLRGV